MHCPSPLSMAGEALFLLIDIRENSSVKRSFSKAARIDKVQPAQSKRACLHPVSAVLTWVSRPRGLGAHVVEARVNERGQKRDF